MIRAVTEITTKRVWYSIDIKEYQTFTELWQHMTTTPILCYLARQHWWMFNVGNPPKGDYRFISQIGFKNRNAAFKFFMSCPTLRLNHTPLNGEIEKRTTQLKN